MHHNFYADASELRIPPGKTPACVSHNGYQFRLPVAIIEQTPNVYRRKLVGWSLKSRCGKTLLIFND